jgi:hypothetical protein
METEGVDWFNLALDWDQWRALLKQENNFRNP